MPGRPGPPATFPRAIFFDLDGTLLAPGAVLTRRTVEALRAAAERGATLVLATGGFSARTHLLARTLASAGVQRIWAVTHNGAAVWDGAGRLVHHRAMPGDAVAAALACAGRRVWVTYETAGREPADGTAGTAVYYAGRLRPELVHFLWGPQAPPAAEGGGAGAGDGVPVGLEPRWDWRRARSQASYRGDAVLGCWCIGAPAALAPLDATAAAAGGRLHGARYLAWGARLGQLLGRPRLNLVGRDLGPDGISKGDAADWLCRRLGIAPGDTAAFGDGDNDLELLAFAGSAVVMANATPTVLAVADLVAPSNREDGVARVLWSWLQHGGPDGAPRGVV